jgi:hypothetical protein
MGACNELFDFVCKLIVGLFNVYSILIAVLFLWFAYVWLDGVTYEYRNPLPEAQIQQIRTDVYCQKPHNRCLSKRLLQEQDECIEEYRQNTVEALISARIKSIRQEKERVDREAEIQAANQAYQLSKGINK